MHITSNIHLDGMPVLDARLGQNCKWIDIRDGKDMSAIGIGVFVPAGTDFAKLRAACEAFNAALNAVEAAPQLQAAE